MGILSIFRSLRRKDSVPKPEAQQAPSAASPAAASAQPAARLSVSTAAPVLLGPVVTEKSTLLASEHRYVFHVDQRATKLVIRSAVERAYNVHVVRVNLLRLPGKLRRRGRTVGFVQGKRKAVVKIREGERIEMGPRGVDHAHAHP